MHINGDEKTISQQDSNSLRLGDVGNFVFEHQWDGGYHTIFF